MGSKRRRPIEVTIVAVRAETRTGLQHYLADAGLGARGTPRLGDIDMKPCSALVLFPDEFSSADVRRELSRLRLDHPEIRPFLVTGDPKSYSELIVSTGTEHPIIVIPKPAWSWTILDAIRATKDPRQDQ
jgi:hypothetical protein